MTLKAVVEALLFSAQKPLTTKEIVAILKSARDYQDDETDNDSTIIAKEPEVVETLQQLTKEYDDLGRAFQLLEQVGGWQLASRPDYQLWVRQMFPELRPTRLSGPALETLAIIAYRQPITKADMEAIRGVAVDGVVQKLLDAALIKIAGRAEIPGRPLLYETTHHFMEHFGLKDLEELPNASELRQLPLPKAELPEPEEKSKKTSKEAPVDNPTPNSEQTAVAEQSSTPQESSEPESSEPDHPTQQDLPPEEAEPTEEVNGA
jgi:segregation and condensation protein B